MKKLRIILTFMVLSPVVLGQNTITTDTILQLSTCAGGNVIVPFEATGTFPLGNVFTAQLSDAFGQFTNPIAIGSAPFNVGLIFATIPANTNFGFLYKIRVVSSNPAVIGTPCPNTLIVTQVAQLNQIIASPNDTACAGDTVTLTAINPAESYIWSTGDTTASIQVTQAGVYSVTTVDFLMCESDTSIDIVYQTCSASLKTEEFANNIVLFPNPSSGRVTITFASTGETESWLQIIDMRGETVHKQMIHQKEVQLDLSDFEKGIYLLEIQSEHDHFQEKLSIQ